MKIKINKSKLSVGKWYCGVITRHYDNPSYLKICVEFDDELDVEYSQIIPIDKNANSRFASFARKMEILDKSGEADTDLLDGLAVKAILQYGEDGNMYIKAILIDEEYYQNEKDMEDYDNN